MRLIFAVTMRLTLVVGVGMPHIAAAEDDHCDAVSAGLVARIEAGMKYVDVGSVTSVRQQRAPLVH